VRQQIDSGDVHGPECRAFRPADRRPGNGVDLLDRVVAGGQGVEGPGHPEESQVVGNEVRRVSRKDDTLAEPPVGATANQVDHLRQGIRDWDDLQQVQVARRVEEMRAQPALPEPEGPSLRNRAHRNTGRVGADDGVGRCHRLDARQQGLLDVEALDDRFDDPVGRRQRPEVLVEAARRDQALRLRGEEGVGTRGPGPIEALPGGRGRDVQQAHGQPGVGEMCGDLRPHRPRAEDRR
jgi:hypothetical protein